MKTYIEKEEYEEIKQLANYATSAYAKRDAEPYIKRPEFISNCGDYIGSTNNILGELVSSVKTAAGNVSDKKYWMDYVACNPYKIRRLCRTC